MESRGIDADRSGQRARAREIAPVPPDWPSPVLYPPTRSCLVPRTRSSRILCRAFDRELRVQRGTRIIELLVVLDSEVRKRGCRTNDANFGIGPLVPGGMNLPRLRSKTRFHGDWG